MDDEIQELKDSDNTEFDETVNDSNSDGGEVDQDETANRNASDSDVPVADSIGDFGEIDGDGDVCNEPEASIDEIKSDNDFEVGVSDLHDNEEVVAPDSGGDGFVDFNDSNSNGEVVDQDEASNINALDSKLPVVDAIGDFGEIDEDGGGVCSEPEASIDEIKCDNGSEVAVSDLPDNEDEVAPNSDGGDDFVDVNDKVSDETELDNSPVSSGSDEQVEGVDVSVDNEPEIDNIDGETSGDEIIGTNDRESISDSVDVVAVDENGESAEIDEVANEPSLDEVVLDSDLPGNDFDNGDVVDLGEEGDVSESVSQDSANADIDGGDDSIDVNKNGYDETKTDNSSVESVVDEQVERVVVTADGELEKDNTEDVISGYTIDANELELLNDSENVVAVDDESDNDVVNEAIFDDIVHESNYDEVNSDSSALADKFEADGIAETNDDEVDVSDSVTDDGVSADNLDVSEGTTDEPFVANGNVSDDTEGDNSLAESGVDEDVKTDKQVGGIFDEELETDNQDGAVFDEERQTYEQDGAISDEERQTEKQDDGISDEDLETDNQDGYVSDEDLETDNQDGYVSDEDRQTDNQDGYVSDEDRQTDNQDGETSDDDSTDADETESISDSEKVAAADEGDESAGEATFDEVMQTPVVYEQVSEDDSDEVEQGDVEHSESLRLDDEVKPLVEAILFAADEPISSKKIVSIISNESVKNADVQDAIAQLKTEYDENKKGFQLEEIAGGYQLLSRSEYHEWVSKLIKKKKDIKLSPASIETLAIIAYKQPILRADMEAIRGVASGQMVRLLVDMGLVMITGRAEVLGRPLLYGTTKKFLVQFGLKSLKDLPQLEN